MLSDRRFETLRNEWAEKKGLSAREYMDFAEDIVNAQDDFIREISPQYKYVPEEKIFEWLDKEYEGYLMNKEFYEEMEGEEE